MRYRIVDFLPLLLALGLIAAWFVFQQPLPFLRPAQQPVAAQIPLPLVTPTAPALTPRPTVLLALCNKDRPSFLGILASLKARLGARMGDAADCERPVDNDGNTQQLTTTGLAYYRHRLNLAAFTNGWDHWALDQNRLLHWTGNEIDPPPNATVDQ
jgi:hypothetical protein